MRDVNALPGGQAAHTKARQLSRQLRGNGVAEQERHVQIFSIPPAVGTNFIASGVCAAPMPHDIVAFVDQ